MDVINYSEIGSTYGGNPLAMAVVKAALDVIVDDKLVENSFNMGKILRARFDAMAANSDLIREVRGMGLMQGVEVERNSNVTGHDYANFMMDEGLITKATKDYVCRFSPPLVINEEEINQVAGIAERALVKLEELNASRA